MGNVSLLFCQVIGLVHKKVAKKDLDQYFPNTELALHVYLCVGDTGMCYIADLDIIDHPAV